MVDSPTPEYLLQKLVAGLRQKGTVSDLRVEEAFMAVPRHFFLPDLPLDEVYQDDAIAIKQDDGGRVISSSSQPSMMAIMLNQLQLKPGANVLEIGTATGYNAAIMQHLVGPNGHVTSVELERDLVRQATNHLHQAGVSDVAVVHADGIQGYAPRAAYDRIISTVGIWDVPPAWSQQLKTDGRLVVPIWLDGVQVSATFIPQADGTLYSQDNHPCGFVYLRGSGEGPRMYKQIASSGLNILADEVEKIDTAALHLLLSDDYEICPLSPALEPRDYWWGFQLYLMLTEPAGYIFALYHVMDQHAYGLEGRGIALFAPASAVFVSYESKGSAHCFAGSDAFVQLQETLNIWERIGRPDIKQLHLKLIPKTCGEPAIEQGKLYTRRDHYLHVWLDDNR